MVDCLYQCRTETGWLRCTVISKGAIHMPTIFAVCLFHWHINMKQYRKVLVVSSLKPLEWCTQNSHTHTHTPHTHTNKHTHTQTNTHTHTHKHVYKDYLHKTIMIYELTLTIWTFGLPRLCMKDPAMLAYSGESISNLMTSRSWSFMAVHSLGGCISRPVKHR